MPSPTHRHALTLLAVAGIGLALLGPKAAVGVRFVLVHGVPVWVAASVLALDLAGPLLGAGAAFGSFRDHWLTPYLGIAGGICGAVAGGLVVAATYPWAPVMEVRNLLLLHMWAPALVVVTVAPTLSVDAQVVKR